MKMVDALVVNIVSSSFKLKLCSKLLATATDRCACVVFLSFFAYFKKQQLYEKSVALMRNISLFDYNFKELYMNKDQEGNIFLVNLRNE